MESTDLKIKSDDLKLTKDGFFRLYNGFRKDGMSIQRAYNRVSAICEKRGCQNHYGSISSLRKAIYTPGKK